MWIIETIDRDRGFVCARCKCFVVVVETEVYIHLKYIDGRRVFCVFSFLKGNGKGYNGSLIGILDLWWYCRD